MDKLNINQWDLKDRPREKFESLGAEALSNAELLAILINSGNTHESAVSLMQKILSHCGNNLNTLGKMTIEELCQYEGIGPAKAITILAACELGKRRQREKAEETRVFDNPEKIYEYMLTHMQDLFQEEAWVLLLNQKLGLIKAERLSHGGLTETVVDVRQIMKKAILCNATAMVFCHNHPSGNPRPSRQDDQLTDQLAKACTTLRIYLVDHVIVADGSYYSYRDEEKL